MGLGGELEPPPEWEIRQHQMSQQWRPALEEKEGGGPPHPASGEVKIDDPGDWFMPKLAAFHADPEGTGAAQAALDLLIVVVSPPMGSNAIPDDEEEKEEEKGGGHLRGKKPVRIELAMGSVDEVFAGPTFPLSWDGKGLLNQEEIDFSSSSDDDDSAEEEPEGAAGKSPRPVRRGRASSGRSERWPSVLAALGAGEVAVLDSPDDDETLEESEFHWSQAVMTGERVLGKRRSRFHSIVLRDGDSVSWRGFTIALRDGAHTLAVERKAAGVKSARKR